MQQIDLKAQRKKNKKQNNISFSDSLYNSIQWRLIGPFRGGRAGTVAGVANDPNVYYMGTAGGGAWKTEDSGNTWYSISDGYFGGSIGAVTVSADANITPSGNQVVISSGTVTVSGQANVSPTGSTFTLATGTAQAITWSEIIPGANMVWTPIDPGV